MTKHNGHSESLSIASDSTAQSQTVLIRRQRSQSSGLTYPHVVRPVPVWIADQSCIAKKTSMASLLSSSGLTSSSNPPSRARSRSVTTLSDDERGLLDNDTTSIPDSHNNQHLQVPSTPPTYRKVSFSDSPYTIDSYSSRNPDVAAASSHDPTAYNSTHDNHTSQPNYQFSTIPPTPMDLRSRTMTNGASRWAPFVNSTLNTSAVDSGTQIGIEALNKQANLDGEWAGNIWDGESRKSLASKRVNWFTRIFQSSKKRALLDEQNKKDSLDNESKLGNLPFSRARYLVSEQSREVWKPKLTFILLNNPDVPLIFRAISFLLSVISLGMACNVYIKTHKAFPEADQQASTIMAICCQATALVYLIYITYDEYFGAPLGLRDAKSKMRLMMLDLLFIIFSAATLSLAFNTLYDSLWLCHDDIDSILELSKSPLYLPYDAPICYRQRVLASFLFLTLVSWIVTFTISVFRLVERVTQ